MMMSSMREADGVGRVFAVRARAKGREERRESYPVTCSKRGTLHLAETLKMKTF